MLGFNRRFDPNEPCSTAAICGYLVLRRASARRFV
jgi:hypothetical protein